MWIRSLQLKMTTSTRLVGVVTIVDFSGWIVLCEGSTGQREMWFKTWQS